MIAGLLNRLVSAVRLRFLKVNSCFNELDKDNKKQMVIVFGAFVVSICMPIILKALRNEGREFQIKPGQIVMPYDIFMNEEGSVSENQLTPVGKMKGEINGEFESFYVAVDVQGSVFINRDIEYAESAYEKSNGWKQISRDELMEYEKHLHFIPSRSRGIKR